MASLISDLIFWLCTVLPCAYLFNFMVRKTSNLPPGPMGFPIIGSLLQLGGGLPNEVLAKLSKQYGPLMTVWLGSKAAVVVSSAEMAEEVLNGQTHVFSARMVPDAATACGYAQHSFVIGPVGPRWQVLRKMCNSEMFTPKRLDALRGLREEKVRALLQHVGEASAAGRAVDISEGAFATTLNMMACTLFSQDMVDISSASSGEFKSMMCEMMETTAKPNLSDYFPVLRWIDPQGIRRRHGYNLTRIYAILDGLIDRHLSAYEAAAAKGESKNKDDFLDVILKLTRDHSSEFTRENIRPLLLDLFIAGSETGATTIEWAMTELLRHPDKMAAARSELKRTLGAGSFVKETDVTHLPYLEAVMKETLRLHPPGPIVPRTADATTKLAGFTIPEHTLMLINIWAINNDATVWENPTSFLPERFIESDVNFNGKHFQFIPFGAGKRICPGIPLASRMVLLVLASLINSFSWALPNQMASEELDMGAKFRLVLQKAIPLEAVPSPLEEM